jgi:hypothetical protein
VSLRELNFRLSIKGFCRYPAIQPRHLVGSLEERLWRGRIPPAEDVASDNTQQNGQQQTGSDAERGGNSVSHSYSVTYSFMLPESQIRVNIQCVFATKSTKPRNRASICGSSIAEYLRCVLPQFQGM